MDNQTDNIALPKATQQMHVGVKGTVKCPYCDAPYTATPQKKGKDIITICKRCSKKFYVDAIMPPTEPVRMLSGMAKISVLRRWWFPKDYPLAEGRNTIGRYDTEEKSSIMIGNDESMSRCSIAIDIVKEREFKDRFRAKLTVLKGTNTVLHNNVALAVGASVWLNYGDSIVLGSTKLKFDKCK